MHSHSFSTDSNFVILSDRPWNKHLDSRISTRLGSSVVVISDPDELTFESVQLYDPSLIFVPHWSHIIPKSIWSHWPTVIFHMTDLPYGRGGSPLQNLIKNGISNTFISALDCSAGLDSGDIYFKQELSLHGTAEEILIRANSVIEDMIVRLVCERPSPIPQSGEPHFFKRRKPSESNLLSCPEGDLSSWFDHIRMLDAKGYPFAYLDALGMRLEFRRVVQRCDGLHADVRIVPIHESDT